MNANTVSAECYGGMCSACTYEDCACRCHLKDLVDQRYDPWGDGGWEAADDPRFEGLQ
jgi:hypothetical protein